MRDQERYAALRKAFTEGEDELSLTRFLEGDEHIWIKERGETGYVLLRVIDPDYFCYWRSMVRPGEIKP